MLQIEEWFRRSLRKKERRPVSTTKLVAGAVHNREQETVTETGEAAKPDEPKADGPEEGEWIKMFESENGQETENISESEQQEGSMVQDFFAETEEPEQIAEQTERTEQLAGQPEQIAEQAEQAEQLAGQPEQIAEQTEQTEQLAQQAEQDIADMVDMKKEDFLLQQIDEFREKAKQLQNLMKNRETKAKELQGVVDEREAKASELGNLIQVRKGEADKIMENVSARIDEMSAGIRDEMSGLSNTLRKEISDVSQNLTQGLGGVSQNLTQGLGGVSQNLTQGLDGVSQNLTQGLDGVSQNLTQEIGGVSQSLTQEIGGVSQNLTQEIGGVSQNLIQRLDGVSQNLTQEISGVTQNLTQEISGASQNLMQEISGVSQNLSQGFSGLSQNLTQGFSGLSQNLSQELSQSAEKTRQAVETVTRNLIDQNTHGLEGLKEQLSQIDQREQINELSTEMNSQITTLKSDLADKIHAEDVKCYRNIQVSLDDQSRLLSEGDEKTRQYVQEQMDSLNRQVKHQSKLLKTSFFFTIVNFLGVLGILAFLSLI